MNFLKKELFSKNRDRAFEVVRVIAILLVLLNHRYPYYSVEACTPITIVYLLKCLVTVVVKCGPPLFFMVSGALLLGKTESFKHIFVHRILRMLIVMVICTVLVMIRDKYYVRPDITFCTGLNWYLYSYIAYLFMLPLLRLIAQHITKAQIKTFIILTTVFYCGYGILIFFRYSWTALDNMRLFTANWASDCWNMIFPLSGWMICKLENEEDPGKSRDPFDLFITIGAIVSVLVSVALLSIEVRFRGGVNAEMLRQHFIYLPTLFIFRSCYRSFHNKESKSKVLAVVISVISAATFGIFVLETHTPISSFINDWMLGHIPFKPYFTEYISVLAELVVYTVITTILRLIPPVKKIL